MCLGGVGDLIGINSGVGAGLNYGICSKMELHESCHELVMCEYRPIKWRSAPVVNM